MMNGATFQHSNLLLLMVAPVLQRQGEPSVTLILRDLLGGLVRKRICHVFLEKVDPG